MMMMMMQNEATASSTCRALLGKRCLRRGERRGEVSLLWNIFNVHHERN